MIRMDLAELYRDNHKKLKEKRITEEFIYGKSFFKNEIIWGERKKDTILIMLKNQTVSQGNQVISLSN